MMITGLKRSLPSQIVPQGDLADLPAEALGALQIIPNRYRAGQVVFYEGNRPFGLYYVNSGRVKLSKFGSDGRVYLSHIAQAGELLGCEALFTQQTYGSTAEVLEDATLGFLDHVQVTELMKQNPSFALKLLEKLGQNLREAETKATDLAYKSAQERFVDLMLHLKDVYGLRLPDGSIKVELNLKREELASMVGITTETAVRQLTWLKEKGLVKTDRKAIFILKPEKLATLAAIY